MPLNLLKKYPQLLEIDYLNAFNKKKSLRGIFNRDIATNSSFIFKKKQINPTTNNGEIPMDTLFTHLTTVEIDKKTKHREFEYERSVRLHWIKYHIEERKTNNVLKFSLKEPYGYRTYIYDREQKYVIILEPYRNNLEYYLLTAYYLRGRNVKKMENKYKRKLSDLL